MRKERKRIIPPRTMHNTWREGAKRRLQSASFGEISPPISPDSSSKDIFRKPVEKKPDRNLVNFEDRITCDMEKHVNYDGQGSLGLIMQFSGIKFSDASVFNKGRGYYEPKSNVYYCPVGYNDKPAFLVLVTSDDIFESQVVPAKKDHNLLFASEAYIPELAMTHDPASMKVFYNNGLVVVSYQTTANL